MLILSQAMGNHVIRASKTRAASAMLLLKAATSPTEQLGTTRRVVKTSMRRTFLRAETRVRFLPRPVSKSFGNRLL